MRKTAPKVPSLEARLGCLCLIVMLSVSVWLRCLGISAVPPGQFTETDAYLYQHQAQIVSEHGQLPARDLRRWVPLGRDTRQSLNLYPIVLGTVHRFLTVVFPDLSVWQVVVYAPVFCFGLSLLVVCLFFGRTHGWGVSVAVGLLFATLPGTIERSTAGFGDRDAFCLLIGISAVVTYLSALEKKRPSVRLLWTVLSGFVVFCGGLSWEGFGVFVSVLVCVELYRYLHRETDPDLGYFGLFVLSFVLPLSVASPAYRSGEGWATHLFAFVLVPPVSVFGLRLLRAAVCEKSPWVETVSPYKHHVSRLLLLLWGLLAGLYGISIGQTFSETTVVFGESQLLQTVGELVAPHYGYWPYRYGSLFLTGSLGLSLMPLFRWGWQARRLAVSLGSFCVLVFFRDPLDAVWGAAMGNALFFLSLVGVTLTFLRVAGEQRTETHRCKEHTTCVAMLAWAVFWVALARDAKRYDFFIGLPLSYFTCVLIQDVTTRFWEVLKHRKYTTQTFHETLKKWHLTPATLGVLLFCGVLVWGPHGGGHLFRVHAAATQLRHATPGTGALLAAYSWMKTTLPATAVVAAEWSYGTQMNVLGGVRTLIDPDHYLPYWIQLYQQHVEGAINEHEVLEFLFTHDATHLMVTSEKTLENTLLRSGTLSDRFVPVHPEVDFENAPVKLYELRYPKDLQKRPEYLRPSPPETEAH